MECEECEPGRKPQKSAAKKGMAGRCWKLSEENACQRLENTGQGYRNLVNDLEGGQGPAWAAEPVKKK